MNQFAILMVTFVLNGSPMNVELLTTSFRECVEQAFIAETILDKLGGTNINTSCQTRTE